MSYKPSDLYRPSNGSEGECFTDFFCMHCVNCDPNPDGKRQCEILLAALCYDTNEKEYPREWTYTEQGKPTCTAWIKWDWNSDGDPDNPDNPKAPVPYNPNQLCLPFIFEELGIEAQTKQKEVAI